jgi:hypothetical protein
MCPRSTDNPFNELKTKPRKPITVGDHNLLDISFLDLFQKPREAFPLEVDP